MSHLDKVLWICLGIALAAVLVFYIRRFRERAKFHVLSLALFIAAAIYIVFAVVDFHPLWLGIEVVGLLLFALFIWMAYLYSYWFLVMGWLLHVVWDVGFRPVEVAPYVPEWYAWVCVGFDVVVAGYAAVLLVRADADKSLPAKK